MARKIIVPGLSSGWDVDAYFRDGDGKIWNGSAFVAIDEGDWADYAVALSEDGTSAEYSADAPELPDGLYSVRARRRLGADPATTDPIIAYDDSWEVPYGAGTTDVLGGTVLELAPDDGFVDSSGEPITSLSLSQAISVLLIGLVGNRSGIGGQVVSARLPGLAGASVVARRASKGTIDSKVTLPV